MSDISDIEVRWKSEAKGAVFRSLAGSSVRYSGLPAISPAPNEGRRGAWLNLLLRVTGSTTGDPSLTENNIKGWHGGFYLGHKNSVKKHHTLSSCFIGVFFAFQHSSSVFQLYCCSINIKLC